MPKIDVKQQKEQVKADMLKAFSDKDIKAPQFEALLNKCAHLHSEHFERPRRIMFTRTSSDHTVQPTSCGTYAAALCLNPARACFLPCYPRTSTTFVNHA